MKDTIDVWFDSGSTRLTGPEGLAQGRKHVFRRPVSRGTDQSRGSFRWSLLVSCMMNGVPPYKAILTHGFVIDMDGRKMSKSKGTGMAPQQVAGTLGAKSCACGSAAATAAPSQVFERDPEAHHQATGASAIRCASCSPTSPVRPGAARGAGGADDRDQPLRLALTARLQAALIEDYKAYQFHLVARKLQASCWRRTGQLYLDVPQGPALHLRGGLARAAVGADRALARRAEPDPADGAHTQLAREEAWQVLQERRWKRVRGTLALGARPRTRSGRDRRLGRCAPGPRYDGELETARMECVLFWRAELDVVGGSGPVSRRRWRAWRTILRFVMHLVCVRLLRKGLPASRRNRRGQGEQPHAKCARCWHYRPVTRSGCAGAARTPAAGLLAESPRVLRRAWTARSRSSSSRSSATDRPSTSGTRSCTHRHVVEGLRAKGAVFIDDPSEAPAGALLIFSAHSARPCAMAAQARGLRVIDATCPLVTKVHVEAARMAREGMDIVLVGHKRTRRSGRHDGTRAGACTWCNRSRTCSRSR